MHEGSDAAMRIAGAILRGVWVDEKNIADPTTLQALLQGCGLPARRLDDSQSQAVHERYEQDSQRAIDSGVFGAPTYIALRRTVLGARPARLLERRLARA
jgi:carboxymethylenebutenolidase